MKAQWSRQAIEALGPTTNVETTASVLDCSDWLIYEQIRRGTWTLTRVLRLGRKIKIPTHDLVTLLYAPETREAGPATGPAAANNVPAKDSTDVDDATVRPLRTARSSAG
jgi:hypothetical protein